MTRFLAVVLLLATATAAPAAMRTYSVIGFQKIEVSGPYKVIVRTGPGASAVATGDGDAIDKLIVDVRAQRLVIQPNRVNWTGITGSGRIGAATVMVTVPSLSAAMVAGSGSVAIDRLGGDRFLGTVNGSGALDIARSDVDRLTLGVSGSGAIAVAGRCQQAVVSVQGAGAINGQGLSCADVQVSAQGSGNVTLAAGRSAKVTAAGSGDVAIVGDGACTVNATGSGSVLCGKELR